MSGNIVMVVLFGAVCALAGFALAFRQDFVRRLLGRAETPSPVTPQEDSQDDPLTYILRIGGVMLMAFGIAIASMFALFTLA